MPRTLTGVVSSDKADKTIVITVATRKTHPIYKKQYTDTKKFMAHDETNDAHVGDKVSIVETRPISARKRFKLEKILDRAAIQHIETETFEVVKDKPADKVKAEAKTSAKKDEEKA